MSREKQELRFISVIWYRRKGVSEIWNLIYRKITQSSWKVVIRCGGVSCLEGCTAVLAAIKQKSEHVTINHETDLWRRICIGDDRMIPHQHRVS